jgi:hypothetical protein
VTSRQSHQSHQDDLRAFETAYDARERLPALARWMDDDLLKQIRIWKGSRFEANREYFDLDHPERGPFVASGREHPITDHTYACQDEASEEAWAQLITWKQALSVDQAEAIEIQTEQFRPEPE